MANFVAGDAVVLREDRTPGVVVRVTHDYVTVRFLGQYQWSPPAACVEHALGDDALRCGCGRMFLVEAGNASCVKCSE